MVQDDFEQSSWDGYGYYEYLNLAYLDMLMKQVKSKLIKPV